MNNITTTSGQSYEVLNSSFINDVEAFTVRLKNGKTALVYKYANGLIKKVTKGI